MGYIDPSAFGIISQIGYTVLFVIVTAVTFFFKPLKNSLNKILRRHHSDQGPENSGRSPLQ